MAAGKINLQANDGKVAGVVFEDGASGNVSVTVPKEGGVVATEAYADTKVSKTGNETIAGVKTFSSNTIFNGNVGIGTSSPNEKLDVIVSPSLNEADGIKVSTGTKNIQLVRSGSSYDYAGVTGEGGLLYSYDKLSLLADTNNPIIFSTGGSERMRIDTAGNVGIGVTPSAWYGGYTRAIEIGSCLDNGIIWSSLNLNHSHIGIGANFYMDSSFTPKYKAGYAASQYAQANGNHSWSTAPSGIAGNPITWTNAMTLDTNGQLTLATGINGLFRTQKDGSNYSYLRNYDVPNTTAIYTNVIASSTKSAILANGTFQSATNVYGSTSDIKLKENIVDTSPKLDKLMQVKVRNFNYIGDEHKQIGVVAQEIEQIFPSIVYETKDTKQVEVIKTRQVIDKEAVLSEDGAVLEEATYKDEEYTEFETVETGETTKNVKYSVIYMMMLKAMQEQQEIINDLKARVEVLEAR